MTASYAAFGSNALVPSQGTNQATGLGIQVDYQPAFLQGIGVLGIGPSFTVYPIFQGGSTPSAVSLFSGGGQIRYQARFFKNQAVVPVAAYSFEYLRYQFNSEGSGSFLIQGPTLGLWVLLSIIEPSTSAELYSSTGISRTYLGFEWKNLSGNNENINVSGGSYYLCLRFEI